jgi:CelD/BcsL family acetyltransferase involved in cellulose biosynthesis
MHFVKSSLTPTNPQIIPADGLKVLTSLQMLQEHKSLWIDLDKRSTAELVWFQSFEWCFNWMHQHGQNKTPYVLMYIENGKACAVLPLMMSRSFMGVRLLRVLGEPHTQYGNILTENGMLTEGQIQAFRLALSDKNHSDGLVCNYVPETSALSEVLSGSNRIARLDNQSLVMDLAGFKNPAAYENTLSKNVTKNLRRRRKNLEDIGALSFKVLRKGDVGYVEYIAQCVAMKQEWLSKTARLNTGLKHQGHENMLAAVENDAASGDGPLVFVQSVSETPVAIEIGFLQRGHYYSYMGAFDWNVRQHAPGRLQMHNTLCWLIEQGARSMDLLANPTDYKRDIATRTIALSAYAWTHSASAAAYVHMWTGWTKPLLKKILVMRPASWRFNLQALRKREFKFLQ